MLRNRFSVLVCVAIGLLLPVAAFADGAVYAMTNALGNNEVKVYHRAADGALDLIQTIATGGGGSGTQLDPTDSLGSQGAIQLDKDHHRLFVVNTESAAIHEVGGDNPGDCNEGTITSFRVGGDGTLTFASRISSDGLYPNSIAVRGRHIVVLNGGGPGLDPVCGIMPNITGFLVRSNGELERVAGFHQSIDPGPAPGYFLNCDPGAFPATLFFCGENPTAFPRSPGQVGITPDGRKIVVTVKGTNTIWVFPYKNGLPGTPTVTQNQGPNQPTYFGFAFDKKSHLIVSEPFGATPVIPAAPFSAVSSFRIEKSGTVAAISASIPNEQGTSCWVILDPKTQSIAYIANNATSNISSYTIDGDGRLTLLAGVAGTGNLPNDMAVARDGDSSFLYVVNAGDGNIGGFRINGDGSLTSLGTFSGLPVAAGTQGLAAY
jgi:6-phosphogluconolactonase